MLSDDARLPVVGAVVIGAAGACALTIALTYPLLRRHFVDTPTVRSSHRSPTPRGGGLGVVLGLTVGSMVAAWHGATLPGYVLIAVLAVAAIGLADDLRSRSAVPRMVLTFVCAGACAFRLLEPEGAGGSVRLLAAMVIIAGYTNAFNFMDGINGISSVSAIVTSGWLAVLANEHGLDGAFYLAVSVMSASLAFLPWNFPKATVFLGDVGSYGLGFALAGIALICWQGGVPALVCSAPFVVYVVDTTVAVIRRTANRKPWSEAHREHVYQRLFDGGLDHASVSGLIGLISVLLCVGAWLISRYSGVITPSLLLLYATAAGAYLILPWLLSRREGTNA